MGKRNSIRVAELFAGVGGFRVGLERAGGYEVVFSNQWEPGQKRQWASEVYEARFGPAGHTNVDVNEIDAASVPECDMLVGGFPCQDYSVASSSKNSKGLIGKKGVLWWSIHRLLRDAAKRPGLLMFENVDRILKSPSSQRGRDFAVILKSLEELGYAVEWRVVNAADYGMPQRRKRVFMLGYLEGTAMHDRLKADPESWVKESGVCAKAFPARFGEASEFAIEGDIVSVSSEFGGGKKGSPFENSGAAVCGKAWTAKCHAEYDGPVVTLGGVLEVGEVAEEFYIADLGKWRYLKGPKKEKRVTADGYEYLYSEGGVGFPDSLDRPSRTIITGEGGKAASRFKHVIEVGGVYRRLTPLELERLNMFPDGHTHIHGISDTKRAFFMGNALVVGVVERLGREAALQFSDSALRAPAE